MLAHHWNVPPHDNHLSQRCWCRQRWRQDAILGVQKKSLHTIGMYHHTTTICHNPVGADNDGVKKQSWVSKNCLRIIGMSRHTTTICHNAIGNDNNGVKMQSWVSKNCLRIVGMPHHTTTISYNTFGADNVDVKMQSCAFKKMLAHHWNVLQHDNHLSNCHGRR